MRPIDAAVPGALAELLRGTPISPGKVGFAWRVAVGPAMARVTTVSLQGGAILVRADDRHWAREVGRSSSIILPRLHTLLGPGVVTSIEVRVGA